MNRLQRVALLSLACSLFGAGAATGLNLHMVSRASPELFERDQLEEVPRRYVAIVPGAGVLPNGKPSKPLEDRLHAALELYEQDKIERILLSGDHASHDYHEVKVMHRWLRERGVPNRVLFLDHAGLRTLDTMFRAAEVFHVEEAIICTQRFHLPRSLYLARRAGIDAVGYVADRRLYMLRHKDQSREFLARVVAFLDVNVIGRGPKYLGDVIPITGSSEKTYDHTIVR